MARAEAPEPGTIPNPEQSPATAAPQVSGPQAARAPERLARAAAVTPVQAQAPLEFTAPVARTMSPGPATYAAAETAEVIVRALESVVAIAPAAGTQPRTKGKGAREQEPSPPLGPATGLPRAAQPGDEAMAFVEESPAMATGTFEEPEIRVSSLRLELSPPELGPMTLEVHHSGKAVAAYLVVDHDTARQIVTQGEAQVREALGREGLEVGAFEVFCRSGGQQQGGSGQQSRYSGGSVLAPQLLAQDVPARRESRPSSATAVDIYA